MLWDKLFPELKDRLMCDVPDWAKEMFEPSIVKILIHSRSGEIVQNGTGFWVTPRIVVTAAHVVDPHQYIDVELLNERLYQAVLEKRDTEADLAILSVPGYRGIALPLGNPKVLKRGDPIFCLGYSQNGKSIDANGGCYLIRSEVLGRIVSSARVEKGNSGGPALNEKGEVVGVIVEGSKIPSLYQSILSPIEEVLI